MTTGWLIRCAWMCGVLMAFAACDGASSDSPGGGRNDGSADDGDGDDGDSADDGGPFGDPNLGPANCALTQEDEDCWATHTGVLNLTTDEPGDRWTQAEITSGAADAQLEELTGCQTIETSGTDAEHPFIYENKRITGSLAIKASFVLVRNVYVEVQGGVYCQGGAPGNDSGAANVAITSGNDNGEYLLHDIAIVDSEVEAGPYSLHTGIIGSGMNIQRVNAHGGFIILGWNGRSYIQDTFSHDVTRIDECGYEGGDPGHFPCDGHGEHFNEAVHKDTLWEQGVHNLSIVHSYMKHSSWENPIGGSSGGCLCDEGGYGPVSNLYISNSLLYGGTGTGIIVNGDNSKVVWDNIRVGGGTHYLASPPNFDDFTEGAWVPTWDTASPGPGAPGMPTMTHSYCNGVMDLEGNPLSCGG